VGVLLQPARKMRKELVPAKMRERRIMFPTETAVNVPGRENEKSHAKTQRKRDLQKITKGTKTDS
jgi:hypothetical protein